MGPQHRVEEQPSGRWARSMARDARERDTGSCGTGATAQAQDTGYRPAGPTGWPLLPHLRTRLLAPPAVRDHGPARPGASSPRLHNYCCYLLRKQHLCSDARLPQPGLSGPQDSLTCLRTTSTSTPRRNLKWRGELLTFYPQSAPPAPSFPSLGPQILLAQFSKSVQNSAEILTPPGPSNCQPAWMSA